MLRILLARLEKDLLDTDPLVAIRSTIDTYDAALRDMDERRRILSRSSDPSRKDLVFCEAALTQWETLGGSDHLMTPEDIEARRIILEASIIALGD